VSLLHRLRNPTNPDNLTRLHLRAGAQKHGWQIGDFTYGRPKVRFAGSGASLFVGRFTSFADRIEIFLGGNHRPDWVTMYPFSALPQQWPEAVHLPSPEASRGDVRIGSDVWIGTGAMILSGLTIGDGAVIGARAVVTRDVPPYAVVAGNPARLIRMRFEEAQVAALLAARWWELDRAEVATLIPLLQSGRVEEFVQAAAKLRAK
jgi:acetyltransferase-like isoleucine patch superfamily enzyme